jgi:hypothetical protein
MCGCGAVRFGRDRRSWSRRSTAVAVDRGLADAVFATLLLARRDRSG